MTTPERAESGPDTEYDAEDDTGHDAGIELNRALGSDQMDWPLVRRLVRAHASKLRESGLPPEQMLIRVKSLVEPPLTAPRSSPRTSSDEEWLRLRITRWAVESYYGVPERDDERDGAS